MRSTSGKYFFVFVSKISIRCSTFKKSQIFREELKQKRESRTPGGVCKVKKRKKGFESIILGNYRKQMRSLGVYLCTQLRPESALEPSQMGFLVKEKIYSRDFFSGCSVFPTQLINHHQIISPGEMRIFPYIFLFTLIYTFFFFNSHLSSQELIIFV